MTRGEIRDEHRDDGTRRFVEDARPDGAAPDAGGDCRCGAGTGTFCTGRLSDDGGASQADIGAVSWTVVTDKDASRHLTRIPEPDRGRLFAAIEALENGPEACDVRRLVGRSGYRLRVGKWRVLLDIYEESRTIHVTRIGSRGDVYK